MLYTILREPIILSVGRIKGEIQKEKKNTKGLNFFFSLRIIRVGVVIVVAVSVQVRQR